MTKKSDLVRSAVKAGSWKSALRIAKDFRLGITNKQHDTMVRAYECMVHPGFYRQLGIDEGASIEEGIAVVCALYG